MIVVNNTYILEKLKAQRNFTNLELFEPSELLFISPLKLEKASKDSRNPA